MSTDAGSGESGTLWEINTVLDPEAETVESLGKTWENVSGTRTEGEWLYRFIHPEDRKDYFKAMERWKDDLDTPLKEKKEEIRVEEEKRDSFKWLEAIFLGADGDGNILVRNELKENPEEQQMEDALESECGNHYVRNKVNTVEGYLDLLNETVEGIIGDRKNSHKVTVPIDLIEKIPDYLDQIRQTLEELKEKSDMDIEIETGRHSVSLSELNLEFENYGREEYRVLAGEYLEEIFKLLQEHFDSPTSLKVEDIDDSSNPLDLLKVSVEYEEKVPEEEVYKLIENREIPGELEKELYSIRDLLEIYMETYKIEDPHFVPENNKGGSEIHIYLEKDPLQELIKESITVSYQ